MIFAFKKKKKTFVAVRQKYFVRLPPGGQAAKLPPLLFPARQHRVTTPTPQQTTRCAFSLPDAPPRSATPPLLVAGQSAVGSQAGRFAPVSSRAAPCSVPRHMCTRASVSLLLHLLHHVHDVHHPRQELHHHEEHFVLLPPTPETAGGRCVTSSGAMTSCPVPLRRLSRHEVWSDVNGFIFVLCPSAFWAVFMMSHMCCVSL